MAPDSLVSDELLHHLMAVGHVDVLVGVPTLNNAATIAQVVRAVHESFGRYFPRDRTVLINSDGGSTDGTPAVVRDASLVQERDAVTVFHPLRTTHRISTPYHGVPGKGSALHQILAAADLTQATAVAILDPEVVSITPEWIAALVGPVKAQAFDFVTPIYNRHPLDATLVTQLVRPLMSAVYGWRVREPLAAEFGCSGRFVAWGLEQDVWSGDLARYGIDLWLTGAALSNGFRCCQAPLGPRVQSTKHAPGFNEVFSQVVGAAFDCIEAHAGYWLSRGDVETLPVLGTLLGEAAAPPAIDGRRLTQSFCTDVKALHDVLAPVLAAPTLEALEQAAAEDPDRVHYDDDQWARTVYDFLLAHHRGLMRRDHVTQALVPLYLGRTGSFLNEHANADPAQTATDLDSLCQRFERFRPSLVERWTETGQR